jgi:hypothetical protein
MGAVAEAGNASAPVGEPQLERPTLHSLGVWWIIRGDDNGDASIDVAYRPAGDADWQPGPPLFRVEKGAHIDRTHGSKLDVPEDAWLFAGSVLLLDPDTEYELRLSLHDPDDPHPHRPQTLRARTRAEPVAPRGPVFHVIPGNGGGSGTAADPYRGLEEAERNARPGHTFLLRAGVYQGSIALRHSGEPGRPIIWRGAEDGETIIDAQGDAAERPGRAISAHGRHDRWFEDLVIRNAEYAIVSHEAARLVVRRCRFHDVDFGIAATRNESDEVVDYFIADNIIEGPSTWPRTRGIEDARGVQITGAGHVIAYNRIRGFADGIDTMPSPRCEAIDFHNNDISEMTDDGIEMDYSQRNTRCFHNRITNAYQGISLQPVYGGPVYVFRNTMYNIGVSTFKLHNSPSGGLLFHNTGVKKGDAWLLWTPAPMSNIISRNNLYIGTEGEYAMRVETPNTNCDFDYDGFGGGPYDNFLKWNGVRYSTMEEARRNAPIYQNAVQVDAATVFASGAQAPDDLDTTYPNDVDLRLSSESDAVNAGELLPGINDDHTGTAPDLGAHEVGAPLPHYGPRQN